LIIKELLRQDEQNVTRQVRRANIELLNSLEAIFLFLSLSLENSQGYPQVSAVYTQEFAVFPQFKKVFSPGGVKIHTPCAQRFTGDYFAGREKPQNAVCGDLEGRQTVCLPAKSRYGAT
jgi:hypothetical protein